MTPANNERHVVAVAGGGKTTFLVAEIKKALATSEQDRILAVTYTRNMAKELRKKIGAPLKYCGTLHHILYTLLNEAYPEKYMVIVDETENNDIVKDIATRIQHSVTDKSLGKILTAKEYELSYKDKLFKQSYLKHLSAHRMISYPLIEIYGSQLIGQGQWDYLFVDEYQDMSLDNIKVIEGIPAEHKMMVYDPMQSIYSFRGAKPEKLPSGHDILDKTYRCPSEVVDFANYLITIGSAIEYPVIMRTDIEGGDFRIVREEKAYDSLRPIIEELLKKYEPSEIAILGRTNTILANAQERLDGLPIHRISAQVLSSPEMMSIRYLLRLLQMPDEYNMIKFAATTKIIDRDAAAFADYLDPISGKVTVKGYSVAKSVMDTPLYKNVMIAVNRDPFPKAARFVMSLFSEREWVIDECIDIIKWLCLYYGDDPGQLENALGEVDTDALAGSGNKIRLMTIHTAKGLEYKAVVIVNVRNNVLPHIRADAEEELRLLYVAATRAKETCIILQTGKQSWLDNYHQQTILGV